MARNATTRTDQNGDYSDWFEIWNRGSAAIDLAGYYVTDDLQVLTKWRFPASPIAAGGYLLVFASGKDRAVAGRELHTNFKLSGAGEDLVLVRPDGATIVSALAPYPAQRTDYSYGLSGANQVFFSAPTPGGANGSGVPGFVGPVTIQARRGFHTVTQSVGMSTPTAGATIRYTMDGSPPTATTGFVYAGPLRITGTTVLRAAAFASGLGPSPVATCSLLFVDDVLRQPDRPAGFPATWGGAPAADYGMDPEIVQSATYRQTVRSGLLSIPILSLSLPTDQMFGSGGIYSNPTRSGRAWERLTSVEFIEPTTGQAVHTEAGLRIQGGASRNPGSSPKHSMSLRFRDAYAGDLKFALFPESRVARFDTVHLRAMYNNSWIHWDSGQRLRGMLVRDQWIRDSLIEMGQVDAGHGRFVGVFVNGLFWGVHNLQERAEAAHYAAWHGGVEDDYDARNGSAVIDGTSVAWNAMRAAVTTRNWLAIEKTLAVDNYIDWLIANRFGGNSDLKSGGNWRSAGGGPGAAPWRFYSWDAERILESPTRNGTGPSGDPPDLLQYLDDIPEFMVRFGDRLHRHFFNDGALTPGRTVVRFNRRIAELDTAIVAESARWGDYRRDVHPSRSGPYFLYERNAHWLVEANRLRSSYFPGRSATVLNQYRSLRFYPTTVAPTFSQHGGKVQSGFQLSMTAPTGRIYFTIDGVDPRAPGGGIAASAAAYATPLRLLVSTTVKARVLAGTQWSALNEARFLIESISINELLARNLTGIQDNAGQRDDWIELHNKNTSPVVVGGMYLTDSASDPTRWRIPANQVLQPGGTLLIWADGEPQQGPLHANFKLSATGEEVLLFDTDGQTLLDRISFGPQLADISTGRLHDGGTRIVTFPDPSPRSPNSIQVCGTRRYSSLDPSTQPLDLAVSGTPGLGRTVTFQSRGGPGAGSRVLIAGILADELPFPISSSRILVSVPLLVLATAPANPSGAADIPLAIPTMPQLVGESFYFQTWAVNAGPWLGSVGVELKVCR